MAGASFALPGDGWRAVFQLLVASLLLLGSRGRITAHRSVIAVGAIYSLVTLLGAVNGHDILGIMPLDSRDKVVHPAIAALAMLAALCGPLRTPRLQRLRATDPR